jgi:hypothetical protein
MIRPELRGIARRLLALCVVAASLMAASYSPSAKGGDKGRLLPCCSACDVENPPLICRRGCSPSCVALP